MVLRSARSPRVGAITALVCAASVAGCASLPRTPAPETSARARAARSYSGALRVSLKGPTFRGRAQVLLALQRPDALRLEVPGPTGARLVAVARNGRLTAVFPAERAFLAGPADAAQMEALLGVGLTAAELFDVVVGMGSPRLRAYEARWGAGHPMEVRATLPDGGRLTAKVEEAELDPELPAEAFSPPAHAGFREIDAQEARSLWSR